jgi:hypothetical protein
MSTMKESNALGFAGKLSDIADGAAGNRRLDKRMKGRCDEPQGTALLQPYKPNNLWCSDYKGEFMLADRRYCYPPTNPEVGH